MPYSRAGFFMTLLILASCNSASKTATNDVHYGLGHTPGVAQLAAINIDVDPTGRGLPPGQGTSAEGAVLYAQQCAGCHGARGEGVRPAPKLIGRTPAAGYAFANDAKADRTIGNYWPYATTVYDYVKRAMPLTSPGSLTANQTYSLVAFLLSENGVIPATATMNAQTLPAVTMPARAFFVKDNRTGGSGFR
jgi:mono/diheme cytochrome c family protein